MHFNVLKDDLHSIEGYLVPDGFDDISSFYVVHNGEILFRGVSDHIIESVASTGRHKTGLVKFIIDKSHIFHLDKLQNLSIHDEKTGIMIYRRCNQSNMINKRVLYVETQMIPNMPFVKSLGSNFVYTAFNIENLGTETVNQFLHLKHYNSKFVSGRILIKNYENLIDSELFSMISLRNPYYEFALRLMLISYVKKESIDFISERDRYFFAKAIEYFNDIDIGDVEHVKAKIRSAPRDVLSLFQSPFVGQLTATVPGEKVSHKAVSVAIDMLSQFDFLWLEDSDGAYARDVESLFDITPGALNVQSIPKIFSELGAVLSTMPEIERLLEQDLILNHYVKDALTKAASLTEQNEV